MKLLKIKNKDEPKFDMNDMEVVTDYGNFKKKGFTNSAYSESPCGRYLVTTAERDGNDWK